MGLVCAPVQQRAMVGRLPDVLHLLLLGYITAVGGERARNGILARCFRELAGWTVLPDACQSWLCKVDGSMPPFLIHQEMA